jgi:hypothetical protein
MRRFVVTTSLRDYDDFDSTAKVYLDASAAAKAVSEVLWAFGAEWFVEDRRQTNGGWGFFPGQWQFIWDDGDGESQYPTEKQKYDYFLSEVVRQLEKMPDGEAYTIEAGQSYQGYGNELSVTFGPVEVF